MTLQTEVGESGGGGVWSGRTGDGKLGSCHSWLPSSPVKRFVSGNRSSSVGLFLKFPVLTSIILLDKLSKSTYSFSERFSSLLIGARQSFSLMLYNFEESVSIA